VQAERIPAAYYNYYNIEPQKPMRADTIAEGIAVKTPGERTTDIIQSYVDDIVTVTEEEIAGTILYMLERNKTLMEVTHDSTIIALFDHNDSIKSIQYEVNEKRANFDIK